MSFFCAVSWQHVLNKTIVSRCYWTVPRQTLSLWFLMDSFQVKLSQMYWLAPNTFCVQCSMWLLTFHGMQEHFERVLYTVGCWHIAVIRCFSSREKQLPLVFCIHLFMFRSLRSDITCLLNNRKTTSILSQRYPCCVGICHTYAKKSMLPLLIFLCSAIRTVLPLSVRTLRDKK